MARTDALEKVTGAAAYPADLVRPDMVRLKVVFAQRAHARIVSIDISEAMAIPGVLGVFTSKDVPYNRYGLITEDQPVLCDDVVRHHGDKVAVVAAQTQAAADSAAMRVKVSYEDLPAVTDARAGMMPDAPLVHADRETNVLAHVQIHKGDVESAFASAHVVLTGEFETSWQEHAYLQPDAGIALYEGDKLVVVTAGQWLHEDRKQLAKMLHLKDDDVIVRYAKIGGAFGGREDLSVQTALALAAWKLKRPCAIIWTREESIIGHHKRHPFSIRSKWAARRDGRILAARTELVCDGGAYASTSVEVLKGATLFASGCYEIENVASDGYAVYTNNVPSGAFRGFGSPQAQFAAESMVTRLAHALDIDPVEIRLRNMYREGSIEPTQHPLPAGVGAVPTLERCIREGRKRLQYGVPDHRPKTHLRRGVAIASGIKNVGYSFGFPEQATATVELFGERDIQAATVRCGAAEVGQGVHTILRQIAAQALAVPFEIVRMVTDDSSTAPDAGSASASRLTLMAGRAVKDAAESAKAKFPGPDARATVQFRPGATTPIDPQTTAGTPNYSYGYVSQAVEVEVNTRTGQVRVLKILSVHDVGRAINPQQIEAQVEGCLAQAVGYTLTEHLQCKAGKIQTPYLSTYLLPTTLDMPTEVYTEILEGADPHGPFGARGVAEMALVPFAAAVASAIHAATGAWVCELPMTPERVLRALAHSAQLVADERASDPIVPLDQPI